jgi:hypothetical protein
MKSSQELKRYFAERQARMKSLVAEGQARHGDDIIARLLPELRGYLVNTPAGTMVQHPFAHTFLYSEPESINNTYLAKVRDANRAFRKGNWTSYVFIHEKPYRLPALLEAIEWGLTGKEYWELVGQVWVNSENIHQYAREWRDVWSAEDLDRGAIMDEEEQKTFAALPDIVTVYRGTLYPKARIKLSWTLDQERAEWFARRFYRNGHVLMGEVRKEDIKACFSGEAEVVALRVRVVGTREVKLNEPDLSPPCRTEFPSPVGTH